MINHTPKSAHKLDSDNKQIKRDTNKQTMNTISIEPQQLIQIKTNWKKINNLNYNKASLTLKQHINHHTD